MTFAIAMFTFHLVLIDGRTRSIRAATYRKVEGRYVFIGEDGRPADTFPVDVVERIEDQHGNILTEVILKADR